MHASLSLSLLLATLPAALSSVIHPRADPTAVWVGVNESGTPTRTVTPVVTEAPDGEPTIIDGAPFELTGTVFTTVVDAKKITNIGTRQPAPTGKTSEGAFARCFKGSDETDAPFCEPNGGSSLLVGSTYYITWNPDYFNTSRPSNVTSDVRIKVQGLKVNQTNGALGAQSFDSGTETLPFSWGVWTLHVTKDMLENGNPTNITFLLLSKIQGNAEQDTHRGPTVLFTYPPTTPPPRAKSPTGPALYIAIPIVVVFVAVMIFGTCWWHKNDRHIGIGNIMSRTRHGYGAGKSRAKRMAKSMRNTMHRKGDQPIMLSDREIGLSSPNSDSYHDEMPPYHDRPSQPSGDHFHVQGVDGGRNVFRDELERQDRERL